MATTNWAIDPGHSKLQFKVKHLAIANVTGSFRTFGGAVQAAEDGFNQAEVYFEMDAGSIDTNNPERDNHLRSNLFLDAAVHPRIAFSGVLTAGADTGTHTLSGELSMHGVTRTVQLQVEHTGTGEGRFKDIRAGFEISGKVNRKDFGLDFNLLTEVGSLVVGEEIRIQGDLELIRTA
ncbi:MAG TPA: YceI family protein [Puia sp.]|nr:YceI family protein [Puia sp.]